MLHYRLFLIQINLRLIILDDHWFLPTLMCFGEPLQLCHRPTYTVYVAMAALYSHTRCTHVARVCSTIASPNSLFALLLFFVYLCRPWHKQEQRAVAGYLAPSPFGIVPCLWFLWQWAFLLTVLNSEDEKVVYFVFTRPCQIVKCAHHYDARARKSGPMVVKCELLTEVQILKVV